MTNPRNQNLSQMVIGAMFVAIAFVAVFLIRIPIFPATPFLKFEPKDVILVIAGFLFGPSMGLIITFVVCGIEMLTISTTGPIGLIMNFLASGAFVGIASLAYKKKRNYRGALFGLIGGITLSTVLMVLWNYVLTPYFMGIPRSQVIPMLLPIILPFNLIKGGINAALTILLYKPVVTALRRARLVASKESKSSFTAKSYWTSAALAGLVLISLLLVVLALRGII